MEKRTPAKATRLGTADSIVSLVQWVWDKIKPYVVPAVGSGVMYYLAKVTVWLNAWGPVAWGAIALVTFISLMLIHGWWVGRSAKARLGRVQAKIAERASDTNLINPLDQRFLDKRISLYDLRTPMGEAIADRTFQNCDLIGPATMLMSGCSLSSCQFTLVEAIALKGNEFSFTPAKMIFERCHFINCKLYNVILLIHEGQAEELRTRDDMRGLLQWLN